jgi:hypothetical protein
VEEVLGKHTQERYQLLLLLATTSAKFDDQSHQYSFDERVELH